MPALHPQHARLSAGLGWSLGPAFLALAALLALRPAARVELAPIAAPDPADLRPRPRRAAMADPATAEIDGARQTCGSCHGSKPAAGPDPEAPPYHAIALRHGANDRCVNCHAGGDRERLVLHDGSAVLYAEAPMLCAQCHGTAYRDWQRGTHGKTMGSWQDMPAQRRLRCTECHDPHAPAYGPVRPLPGPRGPSEGPAAPQPRHGHGGGGLGP